MASVILNHIHKAYIQRKSSPVICDLSLEIRDGEFFVILGPSGCGKTTLLKIIAGLEKQDSGSVLINDTLVDPLLPHERDIAFVFQQGALFPHLTVEENVSLSLKVRRVNKKQIRNEVIRVCDHLKISELLSRYPHQLSGGEAQRVAIARALVHDPKVFLFDEPLSSLDASLKLDLQNELINLHHKIGHTFIYVTHDQAEAMRLADRIAVMNRGKIEQIGTCNEIYRHPCNRFVAEFVGTPKINIINADAYKQYGLIKNEAQGAVIGIRPEDVIFESERMAAGSFPAEVIKVDKLGSDTDILLKSGDSVLVSRTLSFDAPEIGAKGYVRFRKDSLIIF